MMHLPVLLNETINLLDPKPGENFIDATLGGAGHSIALLQKTAPNGKLLGIDLNEETLNQAREKLKFFGERMIFICGNFRDLEKIAVKNDFSEISGVLFDLGMSSMELDDSGRGFSFLKDEPLLMNFGEVEFTAAEILNRSSIDELERIFREYGEEKFSRRIAGKIFEDRRKERFETTGQLVKTIFSAIPVSAGKSKKHPATRVFQALRIAVNKELENLTAGLSAALKVLKPEGKLAVISFHSLEDRIVKNFFRERKEFLKILTKKPVVPELMEIKGNPRARSAKLRVAEKIK